MPILVLFSRDFVPADPTIALPLWVRVSLSSHIVISLTRILVISDEEDSAMPEATITDIRPAREEAQKYSGSEASDAIDRAEEGSTKGTMAGVTVY